MVLVTNTLIFADNIYGYGQFYMRIIYEVNACWFAMVECCSRKSMECGAELVIG